MIRKANPGEEALLAELANALWPHADREELEEEFRDFLQNTQCSCYLAFREDIAVGFAQCQLRHDYVEGTNSSPVGYLEGIYVRPEQRGMGYAAAILSACENWAREAGCREFASDCELSNTCSQGFHLAAGFTEANRIVCFTKKL